MLQYRIYKLEFRICKGKLVCKFDLFVIYNLFCKLEGFLIYKRLLEGK